MTSLKTSNDSTKNRPYASGSGNYATLSTNTSANQVTDKPIWSEGTVGFQIINIILIVVTVWILLCLIIYGTKTRRWTKRAGSSSLNNGKIFTACVIVTTLGLPRLALTEVLHLKNFDEDTCEIVGDVSKAAFALSTYATYIFLWMRQRLIYKHPYVKDRVSKCMNLFSQGFLALLTLLSVGVATVYVQPKSYKASGHGCIYALRQDQEMVEKSERSIILAVVWVILQTSVLSLSIYPAVRVRAATKEELGLDARECSKDFSSSKSPTLWNRITLNDSYVCNSPIQFSIRRIVIANIIIVVSDLAAVILDITAVSEEAPLAVGQAIYDISTLINVFCMLATFSFFGQVFTVCLPKFSKVKKTLRRRRTVITTASENFPDLTVIEVQ